VASTGKPIAFTVDVESDWGSTEVRGIETALPRLLRLLHEHGAHATFFVVGELAEAFRRHVPPSSPHEVGSHGMTHRLLTRLDEAGVRFEVEESRRALQQAGYDVRGFRAPFLRCPRRLPHALLRAGYAYDASVGSVVPGLANLRASLGGSVVKSALPRLAVATLRDRVTPFSLTWLRLYHPLGVRWMPAAPAVFYCHLHELLDGASSAGWPALPRPLRRLHARHTGRVAWGLLETLLSRGRPVLSCHELLERAAVGGPPLADRLPSPAGPP
jgi:hypothetical protein